MLAGLTEMRSSGLYGQQVTNAGMKALGGMKKLESLDVGGVTTKLTDEGLKVSDTDEVGLNRCPSYSPNPGLNRRRLPG